MPPHNSQADVAAAAAAAVFGNAGPAQERVLTRIRESAVAEVPLQRPEDVTSADSYEAGEHGMPLCTIAACR